MKNILFIFISLIGINISSLSVFAQNLISQEEAERIALEAVPGTILHTEHDIDDGITYFEVYIQAERGIAEVYINAHTGVLMEIDWEDDYDGSKRNNSMTPQQTTPDFSSETGENQANDLVFEDIVEIVGSPISAKEAQEIALTHISGRVLHSDFDQSNGMSLFYIYVWSGLSLREITIDRETGQILDVDTYPVALIAGGGLLLMGGGLFLLRRKSRS